MLYQLPPAQLAKVVYGLASTKEGWPTYINRDPFLMAMDAPKYMPAGSVLGLHTGGTGHIMERTVVRGATRPTEWR